MALKPLGSSLFDQGGLARLKLAQLLTHLGTPKAKTSTRGFDGRKKTIRRWLVGRGTTYGGRFRTGRGSVLHVASKHVINGEVFFEEATNICQ